MFQCVEMESSYIHRRFSFNPLKYEGQLSTFGKKVLNELVKKWNRDTILRDSSVKGYHNAPTNNNQNKNGRVLLFNPNEAPIRRSSPTEDLIDLTTNLISLQTPAQPVTYNLTLNGPPNVPSSNELVQTLNSPRNHETFTTHDIINTVHDKHHNDNLVLCNNNNNDDGNENIIDWDNMFDTEKFSDINIHTENSLNENNLHINADGIDKCIINDPKEIDFKIPTIPTQMKEKQKNKRKIQAKITDSVPKKVKKVISDSKNTLRKQKYTKTVKNWLDDVDPSNTVEEDSVKHITKANNNEENKESHSKYNIVVEKHKLSAVKKVVQAQLANKDGIMKYSKPKNLVDTSKNNSSKDIANTANTDASNPGPEKNGLHKTNKITKLKTIADILDKTNSNPEISTKEKKSKPKFVAPIKSQIPVKDITYDIINLDDSVKNIEVLNNIKDEEIIVVLTYSNGFSQLNKHYTEDSCEPDGLMINIEDTFYYFKGHKNGGYNEILKRMLEQNTMVCFNGKHILMYLKSQYDMDIHKLNVIDIQIGCSILQPDAATASFPEVQEVMSHRPQRAVPGSTACPLQATAYCLTQLRQCCSELVARLQQADLWTVFHNIEMKLLPIIADMESQGVKVDVTKLKSMEDILLTKMKQVEEKCYAAAGKTFQINSAVQVRSILYDELRLDATYNVTVRETVQGAKSTSEAMLRSLTSVHPLPRLILEYRHLHKAYATFVAGIAQHVHDNLVTPTWVQNAAVTGRIASNNPNLQAIPKTPFSLSLFPETDDTDVERLVFRSVYGCEAGWRVLCADFRHVECRVWAHLARDQRLLAALASDNDFFTELAHHWLKKEVGEVCAEERERTKRVVYATLYGAGPATLMDILHLDYEHTLAALATFNRTFPTLKSFVRGVVSRCAAEGGRLRSLGGRGRSFPDITSTRRTRRAQAERQAVNFVVQGSAADLCKVAMVRAVAGLRGARLRYKLVLQIHDELVFHVQEEHLDTAAGIIKAAMEGCGAECGMRVRLPVSLAHGPDWAHLTPYCPTRQHTSV